MTPCLNSTARAFRRYYTFPGICTWCLFTRLVQDSRTCVTGIPKEVWQAARIAARIIRLFSTMPVTERHNFFFLQLKSVFRRHKMGLMSADVVALLTSLNEQSLFFRISEVSEIRDRCRSMSIFIAPAENKPRLIGSLDGCCHGTARF